MLTCRDDKNAWFGETKDRKIGFFKSEHVEELLDENIDGRRRAIEYLFSQDVLNCTVKFLRRGKILNYFGFQIQLYHRRSVLEAPMPNLLSKVPCEMEK